MHTVKVKDLTEGMIVAQNVLSRMGQIIVYKNSCLTKQMISQICYYQIPSVEIIDGEIPPQTALALEHKHEVEKTYLQRVLSRPDFEKFKERYISAVALMENSLNDIIFRRIEIDEPDLIEDTVNLFNRFDSTYELFAIIHELQKIDSSTQAHSMNVAIISRLIGSWAGMDKADLDNVTLAGLIHDIGKIKIPDIILLKPGKLTTSEYDFVKKHTIFGFEAIKDQRIDKRIKDAVLLHHERYDGSGYPFGYKGEKLCNYACIVSIADVYDAMTSVRCYHDAICPFDVIATFEQNGLCRFHPDFIYTFLHKIADSYIGSEVLLSTEEIAKIVCLDSKLSRPVVKLEMTDEIIKLKEHPDLYIHAII